MKKVFRLEYFWICIGLAIFMITILPWLRPANMPVSTEHENTNGPMESVDDHVDNSKFKIPNNIYMSVKNIYERDQYSGYMLQQLETNFKNYKVTLFDDDKCIEIAKDYPNFQWLVRELPHGVMKSDFCRYLIIYIKGGIYIDSDVEIRQDPADWLWLEKAKNFSASEVKMVVGLEALFKTKEHMSARTYVNMEQMVQWSFAAQPGHPILIDVCNDIYNAYKKDPNSFKELKSFNSNLIQLTGPGAFTRAIKRFTDKFGMPQSALWNAPLVVNDLYIGPVQMFNCGFTFEEILYKCDEQQALRHYYGGRWKKYAANSAQK
eukprot:NODE_341_length_9178_cov_1.080846.p4 type:complete len:320 gc:universal NODE_341_length_9178_cov_1.080846:7617-6658(-)